LQMKIFEGPAISLRTLSWGLPQNEHE